MGSELEVLKKIWGDERKASVKLISDQTGLGLDYVRYLCNSLVKRGQIKPVKKKPGWYRITAKGEKELKLLGIFKPEILKEDRRARKVILPWPKKSLNPVRNRVSNRVKVRRPKGKEIPVEEKKLRLGKMVEKIISSLRISTFPTKGQRRGKRGKRKKYAKRRKIKTS